MMDVLNDYLKNILEMEVTEKKLSPLELFISLEKVKWQVERIIADDVNEEGNFSKMSKTLKEEIDTLESKMNNVLYHPENGLILIVDRLTQEKIHRGNMMKNIYALWIGLILALIKILGDWIFKK